MLGRITGDEEGLDERAKQLAAAYTADGPDLRVQVGGQAQGFREVGEQAEADLVRAEAIAIPITLLLRLLGDLTAVDGAMVFVFQEGNLADVLGFTATGTIDTSMPVLMFCIAFGLSMDDEVFLLSRIKEAHDRTGDTVAAVAVGLERGGRIVTAAAGLREVPEPSGA